MSALCALRGGAFRLLVYLASGHGINMTVCASPVFKGAWNPREELGLNWLRRFLGLPAWNNDLRFASYDERDAQLRLLAARLPEIVAAASARGQDLWPELARFSSR